jgi:hypothetical protein
MKARIEMEYAEARNIVYEYIDRDGVDFDGLTNAIQSAVENVERQRDELLAQGEWISRAEYLPHSKLVVLACWYHDKTGSTFIGESYVENHPTRWVRCYHDVAEPEWRVILWRTLPGPSEAAIARASSGSSGQAGE